MSKARIKIKLPAIATREEAEQMMNSLAASANAQRGLMSEMDAKILAIKKSYESGFAVLEQAIELKSGALRAWAEAHPEEFPKDRKSIEFLSGVLGFRTGTPKLALLNRSWTWEKVLIFMKKMAAWRPYIRVKNEVDKEQVISAAVGGFQNDREMTESILARVGVKVVQDETFFIEPKLTDQK